MELLAGSGAVVEFTDPLISSVTVAGVQRKSLALAAADPAEFDLVAVLVARDDLDLDRFVAAGVPVFDAAHALAAAASATVERL